MMGIGVIGLALGASFGLCFYMQIFFADMHPIIPFLLLGIGVDDMFVIVQVRLNFVKGIKNFTIIILAYGIEEWFSTRVPRHIRVP